MGQGQHKRRDRNGHGPDDPFSGIGMPPAVGGNVQIIDPNTPKAEQMMVDPEAPVPVAPWTPLGAMLIAQIVATSEGHQKVGGVLLPQGTAWITPIYVVVACGPEVKWLKRGDHIYVSPQVQPQVVRTVLPDGSIQQTMYLHEQQCFGYVNAVRERITPAESPKEAGTAT